MDICPLCSSTVFRVKLRLRSFSILRCGECGLFVQSPLPLQDDLNKVYNSPEYWRRPYFSNCGKDYKRDDKIQMYENALRKIEQLSSKKGLLLDVGCGTGIFLNLAQKAGWEVYGIEYSAIAAEYANKNFGVPVQIGVAEEISIPENQFQAITLWDIIEHLRSPVKLLDKLSKALIPGGIILVFTPNAESLIRNVAPFLEKIIPRQPIPFTEMVYSPLHLYYFCPENLRGVLATYSVKIVKEYQLPMVPERARHVTFLTRLLLNTLDSVGKIIGRQYRFVSIGKRD